MSGHRMRALDRPPEASAEIAECSAISGSIASSALAALRSGCQQKPPTVRFASIASAPSNYSVNLLTRVRNGTPVAMVSLHPLQ